VARRYSVFNLDPVINKSYAFFGQGTYSITEALRLTLGARYSKDEKSQDGFLGQQVGLTPNFTATSNDVLQLARAETSSSKVTWRAGIDYDLNDRSLLFATVSTGYKAGGFNNGCAATPALASDYPLACTRFITVPGLAGPTQFQTSFPRPDTELYYKPETLMAYEIGAKLGFMDNSVRVHATAFYYDYKNLQLFRQDRQPNSPLFVFNADKAKIKGLELETVLRVTEALRFDANFTYTDATYGDFPLLVPGQTVQPNLKGAPLDRTPKYVVGAGGSYTFNIGEGSLVAAVRTRLSDSFVISDFNNAIQFRQPSYTKTDITLTYTAPDKRWYLSAFAKNLEDNVELTYILAAPQTPLNNQAPAAVRRIEGTGSAIVGAPRTFGVRAGFKF
jgi:iron complex outermembrane recepter protein